MLCSAVNRLQSDYRYAVELVAVGTQAVWSCYQTGGSGHVVKYEVWEAEPTQGSCPVQRGPTEMRVGVTSTELAP
jgi:hypothetical protein